MQTIIRITQGTPRKTEWRLAQPVDFELHAGEHIAIIGANGSGKSMLVDMITGKHPLLHNQAVYNFAPSTKEYVADNIKLVAFKDSYGENNATYFLQQRWNQQEMDEDIATVEEVLNRYGGKAESLGFFPVSILRSPIVLLSSGEMRKLELAKALLAEPRVLVIDNPYIGLDVEARKLLDDTLQEIIQTKDIQLIIEVARREDIPPFITHVVEVEDGKVGPSTPRQQFLYPQQQTDPTDDREEENTSGTQCAIDGDECICEHQTTVCNHEATHHEPVIQFDHVSIVYGSRTILNELSWNVNQGEHWALKGPNGSGKSTLLSLVCADNPQAYAANISLFGHQRGTGESIWDIKKKIGYVSPEMHRAYKHNLPTIDIVASGLKDTVGLYVRATEQEQYDCLQWMEIFGIAPLANKPFLQLSSGQQRLALLARAFVKNPQLLILDEPLHGLDDANRIKVKNIINDYCSDPSKTLIMVSHYDSELPSCINHTLVLQK